MIMLPLLFGDPAAFWRPSSEVVHLSTFISRCCFTFALSPSASFSRRSWLVTICENVLGCAYCDRRCDCSFSNSWCFSSAIFAISSSRSATSCRFSRWTSSASLVLRSSASCMVFACLDVASWTFFISRLKCSASCSYRFLQASIASHSPSIMLSFRIPSCLTRLSSATSSCSFSRAFSTSRSNLEFWFENSFSRCSNSAFESCRICSTIFSHCWSRSCRSLANLVCRRSASWNTSFICSFTGATASVLASSTTTSVSATSSSSRRCFCSSSPANCSQREV
mmetsp:Transcript_15945/g.39455  ORF Transcript_15945/g.39455 Transcript_15945/m.39455 type:complete len:281 (+) Transcript_15945:136-978(+)